MPKAEGMGMVRVKKSEEKGSDVNLATYLLLDLKQATRPLKSIGISEKKLEIPLGFCGLYQ